MATPDSRWASGGVSFHTDYPGVFREELNRPVVEKMREEINAGHSLMVILQPGDGTRYQFLLTSQPTVVEMSNESGKDTGFGFTREPKMDGHMARLFITDVAFRGGTTDIGRMFPIEEIRWSIAEKMNISNVCTAEALATLVEAVWCYEAKKEEKHTYDDERNKANSDHDHEKGVRENLDDPRTWGED